MSEPNVITEPGKSLVHKVNNAPANNANATVCTSGMEFHDVTHLLSTKPLRGVHCAQIDDAREETEADIAAARAALAGSPQCTPYVKVRRQLGLD